MRPMRFQVGPIRLGRAVIAHALVAAAGFTLGVLIGGSAPVAFAAVAQWSSTRSSLQQGSRSAC